MTKLDRLVAELCPDGVEYKRIDYELDNNADIIRLEIAKCRKGHEY